MDQAAVLKACIGESRVRGKIPFAPYNSKNILPTRENPIGIFHQTVFCVKALQISGRVLQICDALKVKGGGNSNWPKLCIMIGG